MRECTKHIYSKARERERGREGERERGRKGERERGRGRVGERTKEGERKRKKGRERDLRETGGQAGIDREKWGRDNRKKNRDSR